MQHRTCGLLIAALSILGSVALSSAAEPTKIEANMQGDATLWDVDFVDASTGWAVGDRGVIWHTLDGGQTWRRQTSGVSCRLSAVEFIDSQRGWAAGGYWQPYSHTPRGVLLRTIDGGRNWQVMDKVLLPVVEEIRFFSANEGIALGHTSGLFPSGVFKTEDGGRSFQPLPAEQAQSWLTGDFIDPLTGALAGRRGGLATLRRREIALLPRDPSQLRGLHDMQLVGPTGGWLVGDGALVLTTGDLGRSWQTPAGQLPAAAEHFDFRTVAAQGPHVWVAGSPGSRVFCTTDAGQSWSARPTGSNLPVHALSFADTQHGWAVGSLGSILATHDGGSTWHRQRAGGARAAALGIYAQSQSVPLELVSQLSAADGYLGVLTILNRSENSENNSSTADPPRLAHDAIVAVGGSEAQTAWQFPLPDEELKLPPERLIEALDRANDGRGLEYLDAHLVRQIRMWRPEVLFTHDVDPRGEHPLAHLVNQRVLWAAQAAADPTQFVELATEAGLPPWKVKKVYSTLPPGTRAPNLIDTSQMVPVLGRSLADHATEARGLLSSRYSLGPPAVAYRLLLDHVPQDRGQRDFFSGIPLAPGGEARRYVLAPDVDSIDRLRRMAEKRRNMQRLLEHRQDNPAWSGQVADLVGGLDRRSAGEVLYQLGHQYYQRGQWQSAADALEMFVMQYPGHPLAESASGWLIQFYSSGEAAWRMRKGNFAVAQQSAVSPPIAAAAVPRDGGDLRAAAAALPLAGRTQVQHAVGDSSDPHLEQALRLSRQLERLQPELFATPEVRFPLAVAQRKLGYHNSAERYFLGMRRTRPEDAWWSCAQGERWLVEPTGVAPKPIWKCARAAERPHLDGQLDDACWQAARDVQLQGTGTSEGDASPASAKLAYDGEFLYIALSCRKARQFQYKASDAPRPRDPELSAFDRVDLLIDVDRDYATFYRLTIDHRGWTGEACWQDATWDPTWYVAAADQPDRWTAEAAIPWTELVDTPPDSNYVWAVGVQRTVPGAGFQSWSLPADPAVVPQGFGYLIFQ
ncbi:MAG: YCF48-related protein [Pirellulales bacterium]